MKGEVTIWSKGKWQEFMVNQVNVPLLNLFSFVMDNMPEPTKENTFHKNSHTLIDLRDWFFQHITLGTTRTRALRGMINYFIAKYDHDEPYRLPLDKLLYRLKGIDWEIIPPERTTTSWRD